MNFTFPLFHFPTFPPSNARTFRSGFTLLELTISLGLFVVLLATLWNIVSLSTKSQSRGTRLAERSQLVRSLAQLLEDDLRAAIQDPIHPHQGPGGDDDIRRFGLSGSARSIRIDVIEINPFAVSQKPEPRMARFGEVVSSEPKAAELKTVFYDFGPTNGLSRREIDFETPDISAPGPEGSNLFAPEVVDCRFRYYDGSNWSDSWESLDRAGLPVAIEATLRSLPLSEALRFRREAPDASLENTALDDGVKELNLTSSTSSRIVAYLPTSPVRKFESYQRKTPTKKENPLQFDPLPEPPPLDTPPLPDPPKIPDPPPLDAPPLEPVPSGPQQSWIRGQSN